MIDANDNIRSTGHFSMSPMNTAGEATGALTITQTQAGVILNSHNLCDAAHVERICEMARLNPNSPYDICAWRGPSGNRKLIWSARLYWRNTNE